MEKTIGLACIIYQVGTDVRAIVETRTSAYDDEGNDVVLSGSASYEVRGEDRTYEGLAKSLTKLPIAKHLQTSHKWVEVAKYNPAGVRGMVILVTAQFSPKQKEVKEETKAAKK